MWGFSFRETMAGSYQRPDEGDRRRPMSITLLCRALSLRRFLRERGVLIEGEIDADGFADHRALRGTLSYPDARTLRYDFDFRDNAGHPCRFVGQKDLRLRSLPAAMTLLRGRIEDNAGKPLAGAVLRFDLRRDLWRFLRSFRAAS